MHRAASPGFQGTVPLQVVNGRCYSNVVAFYTVYAVTAVGGATASCVQVRHVAAQRGSERPIQEYTTVSRRIAPGRADPMRYKGGDPNAQVRSVGIRLDG